MDFFPFQLERWQSTWENRVEINLTESGVLPLELNEIADAGGFANLRLGYCQTNGSDSLRTRISELYAGSSPGEILVTNGSSESIFLAMWSFISKISGEISIVLPNYMGVYGIAKSFGEKINPILLDKKEKRWTLEVENLEKNITSETKLVAVCTPNNPTGSVLEENEIEQLCERARKVDCWILSDEVYRGAEVEGDLESPSFWGKYDKVIVTSGLSKAYGLPGLRIGWLVSNPKTAEDLWARHDYTTIAPSTLSDYLAQIALNPDKRKWILSRTKRILSENLPVVKNWVDQYSEQVSFIPPQAGAMAWIKYNAHINSSELAEKLRKEKGTLIVPGDQFNMDGYFRIGYGGESEQLKEGLNRISNTLGEMGR